MFKLAFDGITSFSYKPLVIAGHFGILAFLVGFISMFADIIKNLVNHNQFLILD